MLSSIAIASLAFGSAGLVASRVQSQFGHDSALFGSIVPQYGHGIMSVLTHSGCVGASVYSIPRLNRIERHKSRRIRQAFLVIPRSVLECVWPQPMPTLSEIVEYTNEYLRIREIEDWPNALNGLQIENSGRVTKIG